MPDCIICYESGATPFNPSNKHNDCVCKYDIHSSCYKRWLNSSSSDLAFHCVICRKTLTTEETITQHNWEPTLRYSLAIFFIAINFYKQIITVILFAFVIIYVKKLIEVRGRRARLTWSTKVKISPFKGEFLTLWHLHSEVIPLCLRHKPVNP